MRGVYQHCPEKHLHRYLAEFDFRYNYRAIAWIQRYRPHHCGGTRRRWQAPHLSSTSSSRTLSFRLHGFLRWRRLRGGSIFSRRALFPGTGRNFFQWRWGAAKCTLQKGLKALLYVVVDLVHERTMTVTILNGLGHRTKVFSPIGFCTSCGAKRDLSEEHIIPFGLGGNLILPDASGSNLTFESLLGFPRFAACAESARCAQENPSPFRWPIGVGLKIASTIAMSRRSTCGEPRLFSSRPMGPARDEIMRRTCKSKTCVWRWQERFLEEGFEGLLRDRLGPRGSSRSMARRPPIQTKSSPLSNEGTKC